MRRNILLFFRLLCVFGLFLVTTTAQEIPNRNQKISQKDKEDGVVAVVDGIKIKDFDVLQLMKLNYREEFRKGLEELIVRVIIQKEAKREQVWVSKKEVLAQEQEDLKRIKQEIKSKGLSWQQYLKLQGMSEQEYRKKIQYQLRYNLTVHRLIMLENMKRTSLEARVIVVKEREKAEEIYEKLQKSVDFATVARRESISNRGTDGKLPPLYKGDLPKELEDVIWNLPPFKISDIIETPQGFHIFQVLSIHPGDKNLTWQTAKDKILAILETKKISLEDFNRWLSRMNNKYQIQKSF